MVSLALREKLDNCPAVGVEQDKVVAEMVGCSKSSVYRYRHLRGIKASPKVYYPPKPKPVDKFIPMEIGEVSQLLERWMP